MSGLDFPKTSERRNDEWIGRPAHIEKAVVFRVQRLIDSRAAELQLRREVQALRVERSGGHSEVLWQTAIAGSRCRSVVRNRSVEPRRIVAATRKTGDDHDGRDHCTE